MMAPDAAAALVFDRAGLDQLVDALIADGYQVIGPTVRDSAIVLDELASASELPAGWGVDTSPGHYRLRRREDAAVFANSAGPQSWKQFLHPPRRQLWSTGADGEFHPSEPVSHRYAFLGVRGCDLAATGDPLTPKRGSRRLRSSGTFNLAHMTGGHLRAVRPHGYRVVPSGPQSSREPARDRLHLAGDGQGPVRAGSRLALVF